MCKESNTLEGHVSYVVAVAGKSGDKMMSVEHS